MSKKKGKMPPIEPKVEFVKEDGETVAAYVKLRDEKAVRGVQPNKSVLVYFYLGADDLPVGIKFLEVVDGVALSMLTRTLIVGPDGSKRRAKPRPKHYFFTAADVVEFLRAVGKALEGLTKPVVPAA